MKKLTLQNLQRRSNFHKHIAARFDTVDKLVDGGTKIYHKVLFIMPSIVYQQAYKNFKVARKLDQKLPVPDILRIKVNEKNDANNEIQTKKNNLH